MHLQGLFSKAKRKLRSATSFGVLIVWQRHPVRAPLLPKTLNLPVTMRCNSRCQMCGVWRDTSQDELAIDQIRCTLADPLFRQVAHVGLSGGEPTLRPDLPDLCRIVVDLLPKLQGLSITSNGLRPDRLEEFLPEIRDMCQSRDIRFSMNFSMDGIEEVHDRVRGVPGAYKQLRKSIAVAQRYIDSIQLQCTVSKLNIYSIGHVRREALNLGLDCIFRLATKITRLNNEKDMEKLFLNPNERSFFADFVKSPTTLFATRSLGRRLFYLDLAKRLASGTERSSPCSFMNSGIFISTTGEMFHCSRSKNAFATTMKGDLLERYFNPMTQILRHQMIETVCPDCIHDQSVSWSPFQYLTVTRFGLRWRALYRKGRAAIRVFGHGLLLLLTTRKRANSEASKISQSQDSNFLPKGAHVLLVGCYGGEHVGDAAILGGVIQRMKAKHHIAGATVASTRPDRTRRWAYSLHLDIPIKVIPYTSVHIVENLKKCQCLVLAGGPLMDLPDLLVKHLDAASKANQLGLPFFIEGAGLGPLRQRICRAFVRRLLSMASHATLRTQASVSMAEQWGVKTQAVRDPAFDYLDSCAIVKDGETPLPASLVEIITGPKPIIAINIRPLWAKYAFSRAAARKTKSIENTFLDQLSLGLQSHSSAVRYVFFPMNADQFGFSDLDIAYELQERLPPQVDFRIWECEPEIDAVIHLLRNCCGCITMRFHGCIFALSQGLETLGIDYGIAQKSKVAELFEDCALSHRVINVGDVDAVRIKYAIEDMLRAPSTRSALKESES
jgi:polysaccharide pyruvyl transferase WcaK-like protein/MoaA/NifB/PqqE/SkfB family radical SAM enzyme